MSVKTARVVDPRIEPQPDPVYAVTVGPKQNQYYKIPASGISDSYLTFNNLTTLGPDRAYLDTFELELEIELVMNLRNTTSSSTNTLEKPARLDWTFDSFPFNKCCEEARVNINGGAFFSQPMSYVRAKERYWDHNLLMRSYGNVCPCAKPWIANETGFTRNGVQGATLVTDFVPARCGTANKGYSFTSDGPNGCVNNDIVPWYSGIILAAGATGTLYFDGGTGTGHYKTITWREPIFCSPFSSKFDETYGRPLYNITSMDLAFNLQNLKNMIRTGYWSCIEDYTIHIRSARLCFQVLTIPPSITPPPATVIPYRRFVPYITDNPLNPVPINPALPGATTNVEISSGVYTLNEIPTAIWIFMAPTKRYFQESPADGWTEPANQTYFSFNRTACILRHISITMANTTQILNTAEPIDLYRIAKANGCQDSFTSWGRESFTLPTADGAVMSGAGSILRLIPGVDLTIPEQELIPGANANNMVFKVDAEFSVPNTYPPNFRNVALWILFEYVGVATITPGQCKIDMNPLGNGAAMDSAPVVSSEAVNSAPATVEGSGWWDKIKTALSKANNWAKSTGIIGKALSYIPNYGTQLSNAAKALGYGYKRGRTEDYDGGAVMGMGDFC